MPYENDEYENWDEYEEDGEEEEGAEEGYEEPYQPTQEELEYLELRQKLKESIRKKMMKKMKIDTGTANAGSRDRVHAYPRDNYGSFFGPSRPAIAQRVIEESRSLLENPDLAAKMISKSNRPSNKTSVSAPVRSKSETNYRPSVTNVSRNKAQILKNTRDYSFLLSEDAEVPASSKSIPPRNVSTRESDARHAQPPPRSKQVVNQRGREVLNGHDERRPKLASSQRETNKAGLEKMVHARKLPAEDRRKLGSNNGSGPGRPLGPKGMPSKTVLPATRTANPAVAKNTVSRVQKPTPSQMQSVQRKPTSSNLQSSIHRPPPRIQSSIPKRPPMQKEYQENSKPKIMTKQPLPSSREQLKRLPPRAAARGTLADQRPKAKPKRHLRDEDSDDGNAINMIRQMFGYNPNKFRDDDDDDSDMEANFDDILREEKRSERIARKEDEEELRRIEEEEERERMRLAKKRKMGH